MTPVWINYRLDRNPQLKDRLTRDDLDPLQTTLLRQCQRTLLKKCSSRRQAIRATRRSPDAYDRKSMRYQSQRGDDAEVREKLRELAQKRRRFG